MSEPKVAQTPVDIAASVGAHAFLAWLDVIPTVANPHRTQAELDRAEQLAQIIDDQIEAIRKAKAGPECGAPTAGSDHGRRPRRRGC